MLFRQMMQGFGLDIVDDEMLSRLQELTSIFQKNRYTKEENNNK